MYTFQGVSPWMQLTNNPIYPVFLLFAIYALKCSEAHWDCTTFCVFRSQSDWLKCCTLEPQTIQFSNYILYTIFCDWERDYSHKDGLHPQNPQHPQHPPQRPKAIYIIPFIYILIHSFGLLHFAAPPGGFHKISSIKENSSYTISISIQKAFDETILCPKLCQFSTCIYVFSLSVVIYMH